MKSIDITNSKNISASEISNLIKFDTYDVYLGESYNLFSNPRIYFDKDLFKYESDNENIVTVDDKGTIKALAVGTANINFISNNKTVKTLKINVKKINADIVLNGNKEYSEVINGDVVLRANGELWKTYVEAGKAEKIESNIKKCVYGYVYRGDIGCLNYSLTQKNDGTVKYVFNGNERSINNVKDISQNGYLGTDNNFYEISFDGSPKAVTSDVEKIVGPYLVKNEGKTYNQYGKLIADFKIIEGNDFYFVDEEKTVWYRHTSSKFEKQEVKFKSSPLWSSMFFSGNTYIGENNKVIKVETDGGGEYERIYTLYGENTFSIDKDYNLLLNDIKIMNNVYNIGTLDDVQYIITRLDGSIWALTLAGEAKLQKLNEVDGSVYFTDMDIKVKPAPASAKSNEVITGFNIKKLRVDEALGSSILRKEYKVKAIKNDKVLDKDERISTGTQVQILSNNGEVLTQYTALVYGDVTGKGNPGVADALMIVKNKLGKVKIKNDLFMEAARVTENTRKKGLTPGVSDALAIVKAKLGKYEIKT